MLTPEVTAFSEDLRPVVEKLFNRHLEVTRPWSLHEHIDWGDGHDFQTKPWSETDYSLPRGVRSAIYVNLLTEDNAPYYTNTLLSKTPDNHPLQDWNRQWTMEEGQHAAAIRDWVHISRAIDPKNLEAARRIQMSTGIVPQPETLADLIAYTPFQEKATQVAHRNVASRLSKQDKSGRAVLGLIAGDEGRHGIFYRDLAEAGFEANPSLMMRAVARQVIGFAMPGTGIPGFKRHSLHISREGIYNIGHFRDVVVLPILEYWGLDAITGLDDASKIARDDLYKHVETLGRMAAEQAERLNQR